MGSEHRLASHRNLGSEHSFAYEPQNPATSSRMILPLEPDFLQMLDPSVVIEPPNTWRSNEKHSLQTRQSSKDQSKRKHRSKKKRRHRSSSSSSSSRSATSDSHKKSKKSKRSKQSRRRRRRSTSSSSSSSSRKSESDYGRYKRVKQALQVAEIPIPLQPAEPVTITPNLPENVLQTAKDSGSDSEAEIWSFDRAINEVFRLLPKELCPKTPQEQTPIKPLSRIKHLMELHAIKAGRKHNQIHTK